MLISGIQKFTMLDYPGKTAAIIFTAGCTFRCGYCHNPEFVLPERLKEIKDTFIPEEAIFNFLDTRKGLLEGVVISGGEPTVQPDLLKFIRKVKDRGFLVKLDTNGNHPEAVKQAIEENLLDYIAMDVKHSLEEYQRLAGPLVSSARVKQSIDLIKNSGVEHEFRTTLLKEVHTPESILAIKDLVKGAKRYYIQAFRPAHTLEEKYSKFNPFTPGEMRDIIEMFKDSAGEVGIR